MSEAEEMTKSKQEQLTSEHRAMRELLESWPQREIMMSYEKDWNERRLEILSSLGDDNEKMNDESRNR